MFNNQYQPYQPVPHCDSADEIDSTEISPTSNNKITDLLKLTAHRRIRQQQSNTNTTTTTTTTTTDNTIITIDSNHSDSDNENTQLITNDLDDIDLNDAHADSQSEGEHYDSYVLLLFLNGNKKRVGVINTWRIWNLKDTYFKSELETGDNVRFIYRGKLLQDALPISSYNIPIDGFVHVSISKNALNKQTYIPNNINENQDINYENFDDGMDDEAVARMLQQREMNMFGEGINENNNNDNNNNVPNIWRSNDEVDANRARREFMCGVILGSIAGIWVLIFLILGQRNGSYSRRFRLGVTLGVAINLMIQISYQYPNVNGNGSDSDDVTGNSTETEPQTGGEDVASQT